MSPARAPVVRGVLILHGTGARGAMNSLALLFGAFVLLGCLPLTLLAASWSRAAGGHLPWPALDWALTTPAGTLLVTALALLLVTPPYVWYTRWQLRRDVAQARDVTGLPPVLWPTPGPAHRARREQRQTQRMLGAGRAECRQHALSLALLALGVLLTSVLAGAFLAATVAGLAELSREQLACGRAGTACPPPYPVTGSAVASLFAALALSYGVRARWLRRVEATSGVWLRTRSVSALTPLYYVRHPGVAHATAAAALARVSPAVTPARAAVPSARAFVIGVLAMTPAVVLLSASLVLCSWLRLQWLPG